jgi:hypothetical protein
VLVCAMCACAIAFPHTQDEDELILEVCVPHVPAVKKVSFSPWLTVRQVRVYTCCLCLCDFVFAT